MRRPLPLPALRQHAVCAAVLLLSAPLHAQPAPPLPPPAPLPPPILANLHGALIGPSIDFVVGELGGKVVKGAPYSAEAVSETVQVLADGNRIVRRNVTRLARDSEGRSRQERVVDGQVTSVFIHDPVAGRSWTLSPDSKRARELPARAVPPAPGQPASAEDMRSWADAMRDWGRDFAARFRHEPAAAPLPPGAPAAASAPAPGAVDRNVTRTVTSDGRVQEVVVQVIDTRRSAAAGAEVPPVPPVPPMPPLPSVPLVAPLPMGDGVTTSLGAREFDGVRADGSRTTWTIPAGRIGNERPIEIVSERWYAPDLMLVVQTRRVDPRSGETSYRLSNLKRGEPDASLFKVPADYALRSRAPADARK